MSINATTNYMSSSTIEAWMETKTEQLYGNMGAAMDESNTRADAEQCLNELKAKILDLQKSGGDATALQGQLNDALTQFKDVPELVTVLQPIADDINKRVADASFAAANPPVFQPSGGGNPSSFARHVSTIPNSPSPPEPVKITKEDSDNWTSHISDTVDGLGKKDQLGLINIQEFNSQINQTKQIASALMDAADKSANAIISHIS
ncbi:MAG: hypothetical protein ABI488_11280 [Polyangiaceae bacterium]